MPRIAAERPALALELLYFAVDREELLDEGPPEMEEAHRESPFILCAERDPAARQKTPQITLDFDEGGRFPAARRAGFNEDAWRKFSGTSELLRVRKPVASAKAPDRLAFVSREGERGMRADGVAAFFQFAVDGVLAKSGGEGLRV